MADDAVTLREVTAQTVRAVYRLDVSPAQRGLVAPNAVSLPGVDNFPLSYVPGEGSPRDFYARFGFRDTGEVDEDEPGPVNRPSS